jgi:hypothetical protein
MHTVKVQRTHMHIVKVQRPLMSSDADLPWLVYDAARTGQYLVPDAMIPDEVKKAMGADNRAFFEAKRDPMFGWTLFNRVEDRDW